MGIRPGQDWTRAIRIVNVLVFISILVTPWIVSMFTPDEAISHIEKRTLASKPKLHSALDDFDSFRLSTEKYFEDHIGFRSLAVRTISAIKVRLFKVSPNPLALLGDNKWLYFWGLSSNLLKPDKDFRGQYQLPANLLDQWYIDHMALEQDFRQRGVQYLLVIAPNKQSVYPEHLPYRLRKNAGKTILDQFSEFAAKKNIQGFLNLKPDLIALKQFNDTYLRSDSHWNEFGFLHAYRKIIAHTRGQDETAHRAHDDKKLQFDVKKQIGDLVSIVGNVDYFIEDISSVSVKDPCAGIIDSMTLEEFGYTDGQSAYVYQCKDANRRLLFIHDSFGIPLTYLLPEHFNRTIATHYGSPHQLDSLIERFKPDAIIHLRVERELSTLFPHQPALVQKYYAQQFSEHSEKVLQLPLNTGSVDCHNCAAQHKDQGILIAAQNADPYIVFKPLEDNPSGYGNTITVKVTSTAIHKDKVTVYYTTVKDQGFSESRSAFLRVVPGSNTVFIRLVADSPITSLRLDPGRVEGEYLVSDFSILDDADLY